MADGRDLIQFGELPTGALCLDPATGCVADIVTGRAGEVLRGPLLVNSSLRQYVATVRQATTRFPYDDGSDEADLDAIADDLRALLAPIDTPAWQHHGYWDSFYWDVATGDYHSALFERVAR